MLTLMPVSPLSLLVSLSLFFPRLVYDSQDSDDDIPNLSSPRKNTLFSSNAAAAAAGFGGPGAGGMFAGGAGMDSSGGPGNLGKVGGAGTLLFPYLQSFSLADLVHHPQLWPTPIHWASPRPSRSTRSVVSDPTSSSSRRWCRSLCCIPKCLNDSTSLHLEECCSTDRRARERRCWRGRWPRVAARKGGKSVRRRPCLRGLASADSASRSVLHAQGSRLLEQVGRRGRAPVASLVRGGKELPTEHHLLRRD